MCHCENHIGVCLFMRIDCVVLAFSFPSGHVTQQGATIQAWWKTWQKVPGHGRTQSWTWKEEKQNRCAWLAPFYGVFFLWQVNQILQLTFHLFVEQRSFWPNASLWRRARFTLTMRRKRRKMMTSRQSKVTGVRVHHLMMMTSKSESALSLLSFISQPLYSLLM